MAIQMLSCRTANKLLTYPAARPRYPIAISPLLTKSSAHLDQCARAQIHQAKHEIVDAKKKCRVETAATHRSSSTDS
jgi:hypothetical protein